MCERSIEAAERNGANGETRNGGRDGDEPRAAGGPRQALRDRAASRPKGSPLGRNLHPGLRLHVRKCLSFWLPSSLTAY